MCEHIIKQTRAYGKPNKVKCNKEATNQDDNGRLLCRHHFNKWFKKTYNKDYNTFMSNS